MFWSFKGYIIGLCFGASRVIIFGAPEGYNIVFCFGASRVINYIVCVLKLQVL